MMEAVEILITVYFAEYLLSSVLHILTSITSLQGTFFHKNTKILVSLGILQKFFLYEKILLENELQKRQIFKKILRKSPASNT